MKIGVLTWRFFFGKRGLCDSTGQSRLCVGTSQSRSGQKGRELNSSSKMILAQMPLLSKPGHCAIKMHELLSAVFGPWMGLQTQGATPSPASGQMHRPSGCY